MGDEPPIDAWTNIDESLSQVKDELVEIKNQLGGSSQPAGSGQGRRGGSQRRASGSSSQEFITFPQFGNVPDAPVDTTIEQIAGLVPENKTTLDFVDGKVQRESVPNGNMNGALASLDSDFIKSVDIYSDTAFRMKVDDKQDQTGVGFYEQEFRDVQLRDVRIKEIDLLFEEPAVISVIASTSPELGMTTQGGPIGKHRVATELTVDTDNRPTIDDTWNDLFWAPEENAIANFSDSNMAVQELMVPEGSSPLLEVENRGNFDVGIAMSATTKKYNWTTGSNIGYAFVDGWTEDAPKVVGANTDRILDLGEAFSGGISNVNYIMISARQVEQSDQTSDIQATFHADAP